MNASQAAVAQAREAVRAELKRKVVLAVCEYLEPRSSVTFAAVLSAHAALVAFEQGAAT